MEYSDLKNRFTYHAPKDDQAAKYEAIRGLGLQVARYLNDNVPEGREKNLAILHLEEAVFWSIAAIARHE